MLRFVVPTLFAATVALSGACGSSASDDVFGRENTTNGLVEDAASGAGDMPAVSDASATDAPGTAAPTSDAGSAKADASGNPSNDAGATLCAKLLSDVNAARDDATSCSALDLAPCSQTMEDICCKVTVSYTDRQASKRFKAAVDAYKQANCPQNCPTTCMSDPTFNCEVKAGVAGTCQQQH